VGAAEAVRARAGGLIKVGRRNYPLAPWSGNLKASKAKQVTLKPKRAADAREIARVLRGGGPLAKKVRAKVRVAFEDEAGYKLRKRARVLLR
jgi:hypothetical protein